MCVCVQTQDEPCKNSERTDVRVCECVQTQDEPYANQGCVCVCVYKPRTNRVKTQDEQCTNGVIHITLNRWLPCHRGSGRGRGGDDEDEDGGSKAARCVILCVCASVCGAC